MAKPASARATVVHETTKNPGFLTALPLWGCDTLEPMSISLDEVRHVARLARLELEEAEIMSLQSELNAMLHHFADIQAIDVRGIEPGALSVQMHGVWSEDLPGICLPSEEALRSSSLSKAGLFMVPTIFEG